MLSRREAARETCENHCDSFRDRRRANRGDWVLIGIPARTDLLAFWRYPTILDWLVVPVSEGSNPSIHPKRTTWFVPLIRNGSAVFAFLVLVTAARLSGQGAPSAQEHADKAAEFVQRGNLKDAEAELRKALQLSPEDPTLLTSLGGVLGMEGDLAGANPYLARAVKLNTQDPVLRRNLAENQWQLGRLR